MPSMFRNFAKKAFGVAKAFIKETADRFKSKPRYPEARSTRYIRPSKQDQIDAGFRKIGVFMQRGIERSEPPLRPKKDRSGVEYCTNHAPKTRQSSRYFFRPGDAGWLTGSDGTRRPVPYNRSDFRRA